MKEVLKALANSPDIGLIVDRNGMIAASTRGAEEALGYGLLGLAGRMFAELLENPSGGAPFRAEGEATARLHRDVHLKTEPGRIITVHALVMPLAEPGEPPREWFFLEQELHRAVPGARGIGHPLGLLFDSIGTALWSLDPEGTVLTWNRTSEAYFAHSRAGDFSPASVFPDMESLCRVREADDATGGFSGEVPLFARDGTARPNQLWATRLLSEEEVPIGYACLSFDAEECARARDVHHALSEQLGEAVLLINPETKQIVDANRKACELLCCTRQDLARKRVTELVQSDDASPETAALSDLGAEDRRQNDRVMVRRNDGFLMPCWMSIIPSAVGQDRFLLAVLTDLSELVRIEDAARKVRDEMKRRSAEELGEIEQNLDRLSEEVDSLRSRVKILDSQSEGSPEGILVVSNEGKILFSNRRLLEMWGLPADAAGEDASLERLLEQVADPAETRARLERPQDRPGEEGSVEVTLRDGRTFACTRAQARGADGTVFGRATYFRDVTEQRRRENSAGPSRKPRPRSSGSERPGPRRSRRNPPRRGRTSIAASRRRSRGSPRLVLGPVWFGRSARFPRWSAFPSS